EKTVVAVRQGRKRRPEWPLLKQLARDNNHQDAFNSILCTLQSRVGRSDRQAGDNRESLVVKVPVRFLDHFVLGMGVVKERRGEGGARSAPSRPR
ncbi:hypothetical protein LEMLEM_LOCUS8037, partial [Lemmus lemmus]